MMLGSFTALVIGFTAITLKISSAAMSDMPNFVFVMADDYGWGDVGYNNGTADTPNLDAMAFGQHSLRLQRYYSGGPVCSPTRGTVLTGRNHNRYCVWSANAGGNSPDFKIPETMPLPTSEFTVAEALKKENYATGLFGKWHLGDFRKLPKGNKKWPVSHPGMHGFDTWLATERSAPTATLNCGCFNQSDCIKGHYSNETFPCTNYWTIDQKNSLNNVTTLEDGDDSQFILDHVEDFIKSAVKNNKPFFVYVPLHAVHIKYIAVAPYKSMYSKKGYDQNHTDYYGAITAMDAQVGRLRKLLEDLEVQNNTLLWFASDNGPEHHTPGMTNGLRGRKRDLTEGGIRVPGIIEWPARVKKNRVVQSPVVSSDLMPTVLDILNLSMPDKRPVDGVSVLPVIEQKSQSRPRPAGFAYRVPGNFNGTYNAAWVDNRYKIFALYKNGVVSESYLYDLGNDMAETTDLSSKMPQLKTKMLDEMEEWRQTVIISAHGIGCLSKS